MSVEDTPLYKLLRQKCDANEAAPLNGTELLGMVIKATRELGNILNRVCIEFPDYTLHDEHHAERVVLLMHQLLVSEDGSFNVATQLSVIDLSLLILAAYGHDIGMASGTENRKKLQESPEYEDFLLQNEDRWSQVEEALNSNEVETSQYLESQLFQDFLRTRHHILSAEIIADERSYLFQVEDKSLAQPLAELCRSHGLSMAEVAELAPFPFAVKFRPDLSFLACVLRLADYLDLDSVRAPDSLLSLIDSTNELSRREWRKHQASSFYVTPHQIEFQAQFDDFFEEKALRDTLKGIERERRDVMEFLRSRGGSSQITLALESPVEFKIKSNGYIYDEFRFQLEYREIMSLLMGTRLYKDERVFIRELLQNALDACRHAEAASRSAGRESYKGTITVRTYCDPEGREVLEVADNGSGMTRQIIQDYFMRVGRSYYHSFAFRRKKLGFDGVSQFGIGILSCFMNSEYIEVETSPDPFVFPDDKNGQQALKLEINGPLEFFVVRETQRASPGTTIRVFLQNPLLEALDSLVKRFVGRIPYSIEVQDHDKPSIRLQGEPFDFSGERFAMSFTQFPGSFGYQSKDLEFYGQFGFEIKGTMRFFMLESSGRKYLELKNHGKYSQIGFGPQGETIVVVKQLSEEILEQIRVTLGQVRGLKSSFPSEIIDDLTNILRYFDRICDHLVHQHDPDEVKRLWDALTAQIIALYSTSGFQTTPSCLAVENHLKQAEKELQSFVTGRLQIAAPMGLLTQDGINITPIVKLPTQLQLGIGFLYNLDLCGKYRVSLNAARDGMIRDKKTEELFLYLYQSIGPFLGNWFREENIPAEQLKNYLKSVPKQLAELVRKSYG